MKSQLGFYLWAYKNIESVDYILEKLRQSYPDSDLVISSDAGENFQDIANKYNAIKYIHGDKSHGSALDSPEGNRYGWTVNEARLWLDRIYEACKVMTNDYIMLMEEDVLVKERFRFPAKDLIAIPIKNPIGSAGLDWIRKQGGNANYPYYSAGGGSIFNRLKFIKAYDRHIESFTENYERIYAESMNTGYNGWGWNDCMFCVLMYADNSTLSIDLPIDESGEESSSAPIVHKFKKFYQKNLAKSNQPKKKIVFYHTYLDGNYKLIIQEQLTKIFTSGLYESCDSVQLHVASPQDSRIQWIKDLVSNYEKITVTVIKINRNDYPADYRESKITLMNLKKMAEEIDGYYCYFHTKGTTNQGYLIDMWRNSCDYATIHQWKKCIEMLDAEYDAVGPNLRYDTFLGYFPHFSGTYWWTTSNHIKTLDYKYLTNVDNKYLEEFWIGSNHKAQLGSTYECGHNEPYLIAAELSSYITA
jgi:hypothetical protein